MSETEQAEMKVVPAHISEKTGNFCSGGGLATATGHGQPECDEPLSLAEVVARSRNRSDTDPSWRTDYSKGS
jgi:hypothetical protein